MLSKDKTSFVLYTNFYEALQDLPLDRVGMVLHLIFKYEIHGDNSDFQSYFTDMPGDVKMAFRFIRGQLDKDAAKWRETCAKRSESGAIGAKKKWQNMAKDGKNSNCHICHDENGNAITPMAKMADSVVDNENDNDNENDVIVGARALTVTTTKKIHKFYQPGKSKSDAEYRAGLIRYWKEPDDKLKKAANADWSYDEITSAESTPDGFEYLDFVRDCAYYILKARKYGWELKECLKLYG